MKRTIEEINEKVRYGGAHVIEALVFGEKVLLKGGGCFCDSSCSRSDRRAHLKERPTMTCMIQACCFFTIRIT